MADGHRHAAITADDHGPILSIVSWVMMVTMILIIMLRLAVRISAGSPGIDDILAVLATLLAIGGTAAISVAVNNGLGQRDLVRNLSKTTEMQKNVYISSLLYLLALWLAKLSTVVLCARICSNKSQMYTLYSVLAFIIAWGLAAIFTDAFRCPLSQPYDLYNSKCGSFFTFWNIISSLDIVSDLILILLPVHLFRSLQMRFSRKLIVFSAFACRIFVIGAAIARLVYLNNSLRHSSEDSVAYNSIPFQICTQVQQSLAIMVAAAPALKNFFDRTTSGLFAVSLGGLTGTTFGKDSYTMSNLNQSDTSRSRRSGKHKRLGEADMTTTNLSHGSHGSHGSVSKSGSRFPNFRPDDIRSSTTVVSSPSKGVRRAHSGHSLNNPAAPAAGSAYPHPPMPRDRGTSASTLDGSTDGIERAVSEDARSDQMIIQVQRDWKVEFDR